MAKKNVLVLGAFGQLGTELLPALIAQHGDSNVIATDIRLQDAACRTVSLDVSDKQAVGDFIAQNDIEIVYHLAAMLSATGENQPLLAWEINMQGLLNVLEAAVALDIKRFFWPSSIAAFGPNSPKNPTPQNCIMDPITMYGITKLAGERLCEYYYQRYDLDVRSLRYPGLISYTAPPGGGTTDYAVHIFYEALKHKHYTCFLKENTTLPMMYMPDAVRATLELMATDASQIKVRSSYNIAGVSFSPKELVAEIQKNLPDFTCDYSPDFRQDIAANWPQVMLDNEARSDWGWKPAYRLAEIAADMLARVPVAKTI